MTAFVDFDARFHLVMVGHLDDGCLRRGDRVGLAAAVVVGISGLGSAVCLVVDSFPLVVMPSHVSASLLYIKTH